MQEVRRLDSQVHSDGQNPIIGWGSWSSSSRTSGMLITWGTADGILLGRPGKVSVKKLDKVDFIRF